MHPAVPGQAQRELDEEGEAATSAVGPIFWVFGLLALSSVIMAFSAPEPSEFMSDEEAVRIYVMIAIVELIDIVIIAIGAAVVLRRVSLPWRYPSHPKLAWMLALPLLAGAIVVNFSYHHVLTSVFELEADLDYLSFEGGHVVWLLVIICVQPAIVEEFFFRYICLGVFEKAVGTGTAIFVSAMIFGAVHIGAMASLPILFMIGLILGWLRVKSGGLALPILFHFLHNLIVTAV